jgi:hypothetical protein
MHALEVALGILLGLILAVLVLIALARLGMRKNTRITGSELHGWFRRRRY